MGLYVLSSSVYQNIATQWEKCSPKKSSQSLLASACPFSACRTLLWTYNYTSWLGHLNRYTLINTFDFCHHNNTHKPVWRSVCADQCWIILVMRKSAVTTGVYSRKSVFAITGVASLLIVLPYSLPNISSFLCYSCFHVP